MVWARQNRGARVQRSWTGRRRGACERSAQPCVLAHRCRMRFPCTPLPLHGRNEERVQTLARARAGTWYGHGHLRHLMDQVCTKDQPSHVKRGAASRLEHNCWQRCTTRACACVYRSSRNAFIAASIPLHTHTQKRCTCALCAVVYCSTVAVHELRLKRACNTAGNSQALAGARARQGV